MVIFHSYVSLPEGKPSKFSGYPFTDKPNYHETWLEYFAVTVDDQIQQDSHHLSCASRRALHCSHPWGKLIAAEMLRGITHHDGGFMWFQEYWFPCKVCLFPLVSSTGEPKKTCLDASTSGVNGFPGRACRLDPTSIWRGCSKSPRWVGGTWWDIEFTKPCVWLFFGSKPDNTQTFATRRTRNYSNLL